MAVKSRTGLITPVSEEVALLRDIAFRPHRTISTDITKVPLGSERGEVYFCVPGGRGTRSGLDWDNAWSELDVAANVNSVTVVPDTSVIFLEKQESWYTGGQRYDFVVGGVGGLTIVNRNYITIAGEPLSSSTILLGDDFDTSGFQTHVTNTLPNSAVITVNGCYDVTIQGIDIECYGVCDYGVRVINCTTITYTSASINGARISGFKSTGIAFTTVIDRCILSSNGSASLPGAGTVVDADTQLFLNNCYIYNNFGPEQVAIHSGTTICVNITFWGELSPSSGIRTDNAIGPIGDCAFIDVKFYSLTGTYNFVNFPSRIIIECDVTSDNRDNWNFTPPAVLPNQYLIPYRNGLGRGEGHIEIYFNNLALGDQFRVEVYEFDYNQSAYRMIETRDFFGPLVGSTVYKVDGLRCQAITGQSPYYTVTKIAGGNPLVSGTSWVDLE